MTDEHHAPPDLPQAVVAAVALPSEPVDAPGLADGVWALVEILGHRSHAGRIREEQRFGATWLRIDVPVKGDPAASGWTTHFYSPAAIFSISPSDEEACLRKNRPFEPLTRYRGFDDVEDADV